jgi:hypothetical protein
MRDHQIELEVPWKARFHLSGRRIPAIVLCQSESEQRTDFARNAVFRPGVECCATPEPKKSTCGICVTRQGFSSFIYGPKTINHRAQPEGKDEPVAEENEMGTNLSWVRDAIKRTQQAGL